MRGTKSLPILFPSRTLRFIPWLGQFFGTYLLPRFVTAKTIIGCVPNTTTRGWMPTLNSSQIYVWPPAPFHRSHWQSCWCLRTADRLRDLSEFLTNGSRPDWRHEWPIDRPTERSLPPSAENVHRWSYSSIPHTSSCSGAWRSSTLHSNKQCSSTHNTKTVCLRQLL